MSLNDNGEFPKVNTRVTEKFKKRLRQAVAKRERETARHVTEGEILSELGKYLPACADEEPEPIKKSKRRAA